MARATSGQRGPHWGRGSRPAPSSSRGRALSDSTRRRSLPAHIRIRRNPDRSAPDRRTLHDREVERLNALAHAAQVAESRALGLGGVIDDESEGTDCRAAYVDYLRTGALFLLGSRRALPQTVCARSEHASDAGAAHVVG